MFCLDWWCRFCRGVITTVHGLDWIQWCWNSDVVGITRSMCYSVDVDGVDVERLEAALWSAFTFYRLSSHRLWLYGWIPSSRTFLRCGPLWLILSVIPPHDHHLLRRKTCLRPMVVCMKVMYCVINQDFVPSSWLVISQCAALFHGLCCSREMMKAHEEGMRDFSAVRLMVI